MERFSGKSQIAIGLLSGLVIAAAFGLGLNWGGSRTDSTGDWSAAGTTPLGAQGSGVPNDPPLSACQAAARWVSLASIGGGGGESQREAWADLEAEMVTVRNPAALAAFDDLVDAYNRGSSAMASAMQADQERLNAAADRNRDALNEYAVGQYSGGGAPLSQEPLPLPDTDAWVDIMAVANAEMDEALAQFTAECG
jgi:hypothetical protein